jgi:hypothetical protein
MNCSEKTRNTPGMTAPMQANILLPTFQASCPPPQGSDTSAPGKVRQMALTFLRFMRVTLWTPALSPTRRLERMRVGRSKKFMGQELIVQNSCQDHAPNARSDEHYRLRCTPQLQVILAAEGPRRVCKLAACRPTENGQCRQIRLLREGEGDDRIATFGVQLRVAAGGYHHILPALPNIGHRRRLAARG